MLDVIIRRRSIRKYRRDPVPRKMVLDMLEGAMYAPSASNRQPWRFLVMEDRKLLEAVPGFHPHASMVPEAAGCIAVCADTTLSHSGMWIQDCAAATQNILLVAESLGLGAVWLGVHPREDRITGFKALVQLPREWNRSLWSHSAGRTRSRRHRTDGMTPRSTGTAGR